MPNSRKDPETDFGIPIPGAVLPPEQWVKTALKNLPPGKLLEWPALFGREAPIILELGCGNARFTLASALRRPEYDHLASDILPVVIRYATRRANQRGLRNTRFVVKDAQTLLAQFIPPGSVREIHIYHPQPYHNPRWIHRRLITPPFLLSVHHALESGGMLVLQTDCPPYWDYFERVVPRLFHFEEHRGPWPDMPEGRSRREILARSRGLTVRRAICRRRDDIEPASLPLLAQALPLPEFHTTAIFDD
jgi:tRNA (guanine-N7-)-methyltransferase